MDFRLTPEQESFRNEVRAWVKQNLPKEWTSRVISGPDVPRVEAYKFLREWQKRLFDAGFIGRPGAPRGEAYKSPREWQKRLFDAGFIGLTWPKEYGGRGLTFMEEFILHEEMALAKAPPVLNILGIAMAGPTIIAYGTE